jgi:hypothetical protein
MDSNNLKRLDDQIAADRAALEKLEPVIQQIVKSTEQSLRSTARNRDEPSESPCKP